MKAICVHEFGGPEVLSFENIELGKLGPRQALVSNQFSGINFVDIYHRRGTVPFPVKRPFVLGWEGSGVVEAVGEGVTNVKPGDRVAYVHEAGSYAEKIILKASQLIPLPKKFTFEQGAAFPLQGMTAHYLLHEFRKIRSGDIVLIHAAAGGMGLLLVQWAKHLGAQVIGTVSTQEKANAALKAGAKHIILYNQTDFVEEIKKLTKGHGADLIIDGVGKSTFSGNLIACSLRGNIVTYGFASGMPDPMLPGSLIARSLTISGGNLSNYILTPEEMLMRAQSVIEGIQEGWLKLNIGQVLPLEQAPLAHRLLENRQTIGKLLLSMESKR